MSYTIRQFESADDHRKCEALQRLVWVGDAEVPSNMTITLQRHGGVALGAFDAQNQMLGFVLGLLAPAHQRGAAQHLSHHSHIAAVLPELQGQKIGEALKLAQAEEIRRRGLNLMTWTYDPLEAKNAHLNINKLGAIARIFIENAYGEMRDVLNAGLPSDRFEAEWWLDRAAVSPFESRMAQGELSIDSRRDTQQVEVPRDFQAIKRHSLDEALAVRLRTRTAFQQAFLAGYAVTGFTLLSDRAYYTLTKLD